MHRTNTIANVLGMAGLALLAGCASRPPELTAPQITMAPYETEQGEVLIAVIPLRNETGTSAVDVLALSDKLVAAAEEVRGLRCLPLNRTMETMRAMKLSGVAGAGDLGAIAAALRVDGVIVGGVTAYDPYAPSIGMSLALWARPGSPIEGGIVESAVDPRALQSATTEPGATRARRTQGVVATASEHLDGKNHQVLMDVRAYASGRHDPAGAMQWRRYTASMPLFEEFTASFMVSRLMQVEWLRLGRSVPVEALARGKGD